MNHDVLVLQKISCEIAWTFRGRTQANDTHGQVGLILVWRFLQHLNFVCTQFSTSHSSSRRSSFQHLGRLALMFSFWSVFSYILDGLQYPGHIPQWL